MKKALETLFRASGVPCHKNEAFIACALRNAFLASDEELALRGVSQADLKEAQVTIAAVSMKAEEKPVAPDDTEELPLPGEDWTRGAIRDLRKDGLINLCIAQGISADGYVKDLEERLFGHFNI